MKRDFSQFYIDETSQFTDHFLMILIKSSAALPMGFFSPFQSVTLLLIQSFNFESMFSASFIEPRGCSDSILDAARR